MFRHTLEPWRLLYLTMKDYVSKTFVEGLPYIQPLDYRPVRPSFKGGRKKPVSMQGQKKSLGVTAKLLQLQVGNAFVRVGVGDKVIGNVKNAGKFGIFAYHGRLSMPLSCSNWKNAPDFGFIILILGFSATPPSAQTKAPTGRGFLLCRDAVGVWGAPAK